MVPTPTHQVLPPDLGGGDGNPRDVVGGQCGHTLKLWVDYFRAKKKHWSRAETLYHA